MESPTINVFSSGYWGFVPVHSGGPIPDSPWPLPAITGFPASTDQYDAVNFLMPFLLRPRSLKIVQFKNQGDMDVDPFFPLCGQMWKLTCSLDNGEAFFIQSLPSRGLHYLYFLRLTQWIDVKFKLHPPFQALEARLPGIPFGLFEPIPHFLKKLHSFIASRPLIDLLNRRQGPGCLIIAHGLAGKFEGFFHPCGALITHIALTGFVGLLGGWNG